MTEEFKHIYELCFFIVS